MSKYSDIKAWMAGHHDALRTLRQDIHAHPELGFEEQRTSQLVAEKLQQWGYAVHRQVGKTGVVGVLQQGEGIRRLGLRADMDALPIVEATGYSYSSCHAGRMHACGHDGHTVMLLGAAQYLAETGDFNGTLNVIFQPAEEGQGGALAMLEDDLLARFPCDALFAMHNMPGIETGKLCFRNGEMMASQDIIEACITGVGGHGSMPHLTVDPLVAASSIVMALQTIVARNVDAQKAAVVTVGALQAGQAANVIPQQAVLRLSLRALDAEVRDHIVRRVKEIIHTQAQSYGCTAEIKHDPAFPVLVNHDQETDFARQVGIDLFGANQVQLAPKLMGSEDFGWMLQRCPGAYLFIGNGEGAMVHNPAYDFNDAILPIGAAYWVALAQRWLSV